MARFCPARRPSESPETELLRITKHICRRNLQVFQKTTVFRDHPRQRLNPRHYRRWHGVSGILLSHGLNIGASLGCCGISQSDGSDRRPRRPSTVDRPFGMGSLRLHDGLAGSGAPVFRTPASDAFGRVKSLDMVATGRRPL